METPLRRRRLLWPRNVFDGCHANPFLVRRIYDSAAVRRQDDDPFTPNASDHTQTPQVMRSINSSLMSRLLVPTGLQYRAIHVSVATPHSVYSVGTPIPITIRMRNQLPLPISLQTQSPRLWYWTVDGHPEASQVDQYDPPPEHGRFHFDRGEHKQFHRHWDQRIRTTESRWEPVQPGEYTITVAINVDRPAARGVTDETTVTITGKLPRSKGRGFHHGLPIEPTLVRVQIRSRSTSRCLYARLRVRLRRRTCATDGGV